MSRLVPDLAVTKRSFYLVVLPFAALVLFGIGLYGISAASGSQLGGAWQLLSAAVLGVIGAWASARPNSLELVERVLVVAVFAMFLAAVATTAVFVPYDDPGYLTALTRIAFWLPTVVAFGFLVLGVRGGAVMAAVLWTILSGVVLVHFAFGAASPTGPGFESILEALAANGVAILLLSGFALVRRDTEVKAAAMEIQAYTDALTGLANRRHGEYALEMEVERAERYGRSLSVLQFDLDFFKAVNDVHGHAVGDRVLASMRGLLDDRMRPSDLLARWGGEEFLLIAPEMREEDAARLAERLRYLVGHHDFGTGWQLTASFGVAERLEGESAAELVRRSDEAMYAAKRDGRDAVRLASGPGEKARPTGEMFFPDA